MTVVMRLSLPSRLRGSGGFTPLFHTSIPFEALEKGLPVPGPFQAPLNHKEQLLHPTFRGLEMQHYGFTIEKGTPFVKGYFMACQALDPSCAGGDFPNAV